LVNEKQSLFRAANVAILSPDLVFFKASSCARFFIFWQDKSGVTGQQELKQFVQKTKQHLKI
jgi:hypothetical protein